MASPATSRFRFRTKDGSDLEAPREWRRGLIEVDLPPEHLAHTTLLCQGQPLRLFVQSLAGQPRLFAEWPLSGTGRYRLALESAGLSEQLEIEVVPEKISVVAYARLIDDLQTRLPASVAIGLQRAGALAGLRLKPPGESTLAQELARLRQAVQGTDRSAGLVATLPAIGRDPHRLLVKREQWVEADRVRRLEPVGLVNAVRKANNLDPETGLPFRVPDVRVEHTVDVYENRLVRSFYDQVASRLRRLGAALAAQGSLSALVEAEELARAVRRARRTAAFLDEVGPLAHTPARGTMVLLRRPEYRSLLESYLRFRRSAYVQLEEPALEAPLENLPVLYERWGTLKVIDALLEVAPRCDYEVVTQRLTRHIDGGLYVRVLSDGRPAVELRHRVDGSRVSLIPQRTYPRTDGRLHSISFSQIPDISVEIRRPQRSPQVYLFDPKYKLQSEEGAELADSRPKKTDIDTMHAYRDAIRDSQGERVVRYAAILYPGPQLTYGEGIEALSASPEGPQALERRLRTVMQQALVESS
jgi:predicted component of viral defense system (DUF524 family)